MKVKQIQVYREKVIETLKAAPEVIRCRILLNLILTIILVVFSGLFLMGSLLLKIEVLRDAALIFVLMAIFFSMSLPKYYRCSKAYVAVTGKVISIRKKPIKSILALRCLRNVVLTDCVLEGLVEKRTEVDMEIQIPDTFFLKISENQIITFYYDADDYKIHHFIAYKKKGD